MELITISLNQRMISLVLKCFQLSGLCPYSIERDLSGTSELIIKRALNIKLVVLTVLALTLGLLPETLAMVKAAAHRFDASDKGFSVAGSYVWTLISAFHVPAQVFYLVMTSGNLAKLFSCLLSNPNSKQLKFKIDPETKILIFGFTSLLFCIQFYGTLGTLPYIYDLHPFFHYAFCLSSAYDYFIRGLLLFSFYIFCKFFEQNLKSITKNLIGDLGKAVSGNQINKKGIDAALEKYRTILLWNHTVKDLTMDCFSFPIAASVAHCFTALVMTGYYTIHYVLASRDALFVYPTVFAFEFTRLMMILLPPGNVSKTVSVKIELYSCFNLRFYTHLRRIF